MKLPKMKLIQRWSHNFFSMIRQNYLFSLFYCMQMKQFNEFWTMLELIHPQRLNSQYKTLEIQLKLKNHINNDLFLQKNESNNLLIIAF